MIPLAVPNLSGNEERYLRECVATNFVSSIGPFVERFEKMVAEISGGLYAVATTSGTTGLHVALTAVGVARDDLVILPSMTFIASANAISQCGATPWLFDVEPDSWTLDPKQVAARLRDQTFRHDGNLIHKITGRRVAAILPVYTLGLPARMPELTALSSEYGLPIVADAAAAIGATLEGRRPAELSADLSVFSFNGNKTVTAGGGGAVVGDDEALCKLVRHLTATARIDGNYTHDLIGFNYRMTNLEAAVGCAQLEQSDTFIKIKRKISTRYNKALTDLEGVKAFPAPDWAESACWFSGITLTPPDAPSVTDIIPKLIDQGIDIRPFWKPVHLQVPYSDAPMEDCSTTDELWHRILTLPCSTNLCIGDQERVIAAVRKCVDAA